MRLWGLSYPATAGDCSTVCAEQGCLQEVAATLPDRNNHVVGKQPPHAHTRCALLQPMPRQRHKHTPGADDTTLPQNRQGWVLEHKQHQQHSFILYTPQPFQPAHPHPRTHLCVTWGSPSRVHAPNPRPPCTVIPTIGVCTEDSCTQHKLTTTCVACRYLLDKPSPACGLFTSRNPQPQDHPTPHSAVTARCYPNTLKPPKKPSSAPNQNRSVTCSQNRSVACSGSSICSKRASSVQAASVCRRCEKSDTRHAGGGASSQRVCRRRREGPQCGDNSKMNKTHTHTEPEPVPKSVGSPSGLGTWARVCCTDLTAAQHRRTPSYSTQHSRPSSNSTGVEFQSQWLG